MALPTDSCIRPARPADGFERNFENF